MCQLLAPSAPRNAIPNLDLRQNFGLAAACDFRYFSLLRTENGAVDLCPLPGRSQAHEPYHRRTPATLQGGRGMSPDPSAPTPQPGSAHFPVNNVIVGHRHRKDLGDIDGLARSIETVGLLQPIVLLAS